MPPENECWAPLWLGRQLGLVLGVGRNLSVPKRYNL